MIDSFGARSTLRVGTQDFEIFSLAALPELARLPYSLRILAENLLRAEDGVNVTADHIRALAVWDPAAQPTTEIQFTPARVLLQDFTGVPCVVDLATMREAVIALGGDPAAVNPLTPAELVIDHSVQVDFFGSPDALRHNTELEYTRNRERYQFLRWGQNAFDNFRVVPPGTGIVHQVNIEHLARVVMTRERDGAWQAFPDTCVGTDSHTTMVNGLGVLGWGVGGIEAEAAMLGQPISMLIPQVVGFKLTGEISPGVTATDVVLTITELLRAHGVVGSFVEFYGSGVGGVSLANRATIGNMSPEFGSTAAIFPIDDITLDYLRLTGRSEADIALVEAYTKAQGLFHDPTTECEYSAYLELDLSTVEPSIAGPRRPQDRIPLKSAQAAVRADLPTCGGATSAVVHADDEDYELVAGAVVIAALTSCTNTSNPSVMLAAGLLARNAVSRGLRRKRWVKTSLAPGSKVVTDYYTATGLLEPLRLLGFDVVGYGCATCIGNSGPLPAEVSAAVRANDLAVAAVVSGNRNFDGRINPDVKLNYLASPPLVVAYALAGRMDIDFAAEPLGTDSGGEPVYLADIWPSEAEIEAATASLHPQMYATSYADVFSGDENWRALPTPSGETFAWDDGSTYVRKPPYFDALTRQPEPVRDITGARVLAKLGDSVTTDHISPAGSIAEDSPAGQYLVANAVPPQDFNSYGSRRGNHEVMARGTFANIRLQNQLVPGVQGGYTVNYLTGQQSTIFDAAEAYTAAKVPLIVLGGAEYGTGSSRDWAAKGVALLGVQAVLAVSFERIHRSNLIGMGVLPLEFPTGETADTLGLDGTEVFDISGLAAMNSGPVPDTVTVTATKPGSPPIEFLALVRIDTPAEADYFRHGGILQYVLRDLAGC
jgi:aconitate hydratase